MTTPFKTLSYAALAAALLLPAGAWAQTKPGGGVAGPAPAPPAAAAPSIKAPIGGGGPGFGQPAGPRMGSPASPRFRNGAVAVNRPGYPGAGRTGWNGGHRRHAGRRWYGPGVGFGAGLAVGSLLAPPYYDDGYAYDDSYVVADDGDVDYCIRRYRSYDPASGTYLGYDGLRHPCP